MADHMTQRNKILAYCKKFGSITIREAFTNLDINNPSARISELRKQGLIDADCWEARVNEDGTETKWKRYFMKKDGDTE